MSANPIRPTVGRIVLFRSSTCDLGNGADEVPAIVTRVWNDNCVNVVVFGDVIAPFPATSVMYAEENEPATFGNAWRWMPYQKAVAAGEIAPLRHA